MDFADYQHELAALAAAHKARCAAFTTESLRTFSAARIALETSYKCDKAARRELKVYQQLLKLYPNPGTVLNTADSYDFGAIMRMCEIDPRFSFDAQTGQVSVSLKP